MSTQRASLKIEGQVQGVFYRESAKTEARRLGLVGWVRNMDDGSVQALAEGAPDSLEAFVAWCRKGPPAARVASLTASFEPATGQFDSFVVVR